jgi:pimeloyl-ACP methyl ester carboxylesterase
LVHVDERWYEIPQAFRPDTQRPATAIEMELARRETQTDAEDYGRMTTQTEQLDGTIVRHNRAGLPDIDLHYVEAGEGSLVVLLHGFPEFWYSWRHQIPALVDAGFRVIAPDMRGYNTSEKPDTVADYDIDRLADDVSDLLAHLGEDSAHVVGHDWGAAVAWHFAGRHPDKLDKLAILNVPHPDTMMRWLKTPRQLLKSWYMFFFQLPWLPEALLRAGDFAYPRRVCKHGTVREGAFTDEDIERYIEAYKQPGALTAMINYYRALMRSALDKPKSPVIEAQTLVIWGEQDLALRVEMADPPQRLVPNARVEKLPDASHWVQMDRPEKVNSLLLEFLDGATSPAT